MEFVPEQKNKSVFKTYLVYFISLIAFTCVRIMSSLGVFSGLHDNWIDIIYTSIIEVGCLFILPLVLYSVFLNVKPRQVFKTCNFYKMSFKTVLYSVILGFFIYFLTLILSNFFNGILFLFGYSSGNGGGSSEITLVTYLIQIVTTAILPAFCEEFLHRGIALQGTKHMGFHKSIFFSSILFGLIHLNVTQVFYAAILGFVMGYASVLSKNIWPAIIVHFMNNFMSITNSFLMSASEGYANFVNNVYESIFNTNFIIIVLALTIGVGLLLFIVLLMLNRLYYHGMVKKVERAITSAYTVAGEAKTNEPIVLNAVEVKYLVENTTTLNLDINSSKNPIDSMMPKQDKIYNAKYKDKIFLKASIILGTIVTIFTFIWGIM